MAAPRARSRRLLSVLVVFASVGASSIIALGFLGRVGVAFDSLSHFRLHAGIAALALAVMLACRGRWWIAGTTSAFAAIGLLATLPFLFRPTASPPASGVAVYSLLQMNLLFRPVDPSDVLRTIAEARPDVVTVQKMTPEWRRTFRAIEAVYPYQLHCDDADGFVGDSAILSRRPFLQGSATVCDRRNSLAAARIDFNGVGVTVASHHQLWPWPYGQWRRLDRLRETLRSLPKPVVLAGDFNAVPWSFLVRTYENILDARAVPGIRGSWVPDLIPFDWARYIGLPIDNVIVSDAIAVSQVRTLPATTSDHLPVLVTFAVNERVPTTEPPVAAVGLTSRP